MTFSDPYGRDVLSGGRTHKRRQSAKVPATPGEVVEEVQTGFVGAIVGVQKAPGGFGVVLEDRAGKRRVFPLGGGFWIDGQPVELVRPRTAQQPPQSATGRPPRPATAAGGRATPGRTASGSVAVTGARARVALPSRIWVEGKHDAELVEKIWGDDLRIEGVVVEPLGGLDLLEEKLREFGPDAAHRVGVLADHLVAGSKESRIAEAVVARGGYAGCVHIIGHPFIDIWAAVKPAAVGIREWPDVPRGEDWKTGVLARIGWPHADHRDTARAWARILRSVHTLADVDPALSGRVEELIDFVTVNRH